MKAKVINKEVVKRWIVIPNTMCISMQLKDANGVTWNFLYPNYGHNQKAWDAVKYIRLNSEIEIDGELVLGTYVNSFNRECTSRNIYNATEIKTGRKTIKLRR